MLEKSIVGLMIVALGAFFWGCSTETGGDHDHPAETGRALAEEDAHSHAAEGPHGGHLIVLGDEQYHAELVHDEETHTVTVHLLDAAIENPVSADPPQLTLQLFQDGQFVDYALDASQSEAGASEFSLADEALCDTLLHAEEVRGRLQVTIEGEQFTGIIEHHAHDHEGHAQDDDQEQHDYADGDAHEHDHADGDTDGHDHE